MFGFSVMASFASPHHKDRYMYQISLRGFIMLVLKNLNPFVAEPNGLKSDDSK